jgi:polyhydroxybutyrate depolymerase
LFTVSMAISLVFGPVAHAYAACDGTPSASSRQTIVVDGLTRQFIVRAPARADGRTPAALVFAFHPFGMNGDYMAARVPIAREWRDAVTIYPTGALRPGSGASPAWQNLSGELGDRDLHFFDAMLAWAKEHLCVDEHRVFAMGYSNGAGFAYLLACERASTISGLAIASGRLPCSPARPTPVIINHGARDSTIAYDEARRAARAWSTVNGCAAPPTPTPGACAAASSCASAPVTLCTYAGGHEYHFPFTATLVDFLRR